MPLSGKGTTLNLILYNCRKWQHLGELVAVLNYLQDEFPLVALQGKEIGEGLNSARIPLNRKDFAAYCETEYRQGEIWRRQYRYEGAPEARLYLYFRVPFLGGIQETVLSHEDLPVIMMATKYPNNYRTVSFTVTPSRGQTLKWGTTKNYREDVMQLYAAMGKRLVKLLAPYYVWIAENADHQEHIHRQEVLSHHFDTIYWANYFGPGYLSQEVEELFLTAPVGLVRQLEGGLWYQLHEHFENVPEQEVEEIEEQVKAHFKSLNLDRVQWRYAPSNHS